jgi:hypothetical protein
LRHDLRHQGRDMGKIHRHIALRERLAVNRRFGFVNVMAKRFQQFGGFAHSGDVFGIDPATNGRARREPDAQAPRISPHLFAVRAQRRRDVEWLTGRRACQAIEHGRRIAHRAGQGMATYRPFP